MKGMAGLVCAAFASTLFAQTDGQTIDLSGIISNTAGTPVEKAVVTLLGENLKDTTDASGAYSFKSLPTGFSSSVQPSENISLDHGVLVFQMTEASPVKLEVFDLTGKLLKKDIIPRAQAGEYRLSLAEQDWGSRLLIVRATLGSQVASFRVLQLSNGKAEATYLSDASPARKMVDVNNAVDTIIVTAEGYITDSVAIASYEQTQNITLDSVPSDTGRSAGCGVSASMSSGTYTITSASLTRQFIIDIPTNYDKNHPYRLIFGVHPWYGTMGNIASGADVPQTNNSWAYYGLKRLADNSTIFIAPQGLGSPTGWSQGDADITFFEDMVAKAESSLCIDTTRIFSIGFSFGGAMTHVLAATHPETFRAVVVLDGGTMSGDPSATGQIAYMGVHGTNPSEFVPLDWGKGLRDKFVAIDGCTDTTLTDAVVGSRSHTCYDYNGCADGYPVKWCTFDGTHHAAPYDGPLIDNNEDNGDSTWVPAMSWEFISQF